MGATCSKKEVIVASVAEFVNSDHESLSSHCSDIQEETLIPHVKTSPVKPETFQLGHELQPRKSLFPPQEESRERTLSSHLPADQRTQLYKECFSRRLQVLQQKPPAKAAAGETVQTFADGSVYRGETKAGLFHGHGSIVLANGKQYSGQWAHGKMHGVGTYKWPDGREYVGEYSANKMHGQGTYKWPDHKKYVGAFQNGRQHGLGTYSYKQQDVQVTRKGRWVSGKRVAWLDN